MSLFTEIHLQKYPPPVYVVSRKSHKGGQKGFLIGYSLV